PVHPVRSRPDADAQLSAGFRWGVAGVGGAGGPRRGRDRRSVVAATPEEGPWAHASPRAVPANRLPRASPALLQPHGAGPAGLGPRRRTAHGVHPHHHGRPQCLRLLPRLAGAPDHRGGHAFRCRGASLATSWHRLGARPIGAWAGLLVAWPPSVP